MIRARILIVEDEEIFQNLLRYNLESQGYHVATCSRGDHAEMKLAEFRPHLLILDWMLPGLSGIEVLRKLRIRELVYRPSVIMLTGRCAVEDRNRGMETGADEYFVKPFSVPRLLSRVRNLLDASDNTHGPRGRRQ